MKQEEGTRNTSSIGLHSHVINGDVFAFDRLTGELLWNRNVSDEAIDLQQPVDLPVLIFSSRITETIANRRTANRTGILILDARNGKTVYEEDWEEPPSVFEVRTTRDYHRIILEFYRSMVMLEIEDAQPEGEKQPGS